MPPMAALSSWENFYVIIGSSAGALIGLQFVVMTLVANMPITRGDAQAGTAAFTTPSVIHFGVVLLLSALDSIPWKGASPRWRSSGAGSAESFIARLRLAGCDRKPPTRPFSKISYFMYY